MKVSAAPRRSPVHPKPHVRSSATLLALAYAALVVYASLYPFVDWRWPPGQTLLQLLALPRSAYHDSFDLQSNLLGYLPLGLLITIACRRSGVQAWAALLIASAAAVLLSYGCEVLQSFVPRRVPALEDLLLNSLGGLAGAGLALLIHRVGLVDRWQDFRARWFSGDAAGALVLLVLWPVGLLFPSPVPFGLGQVGARLQELLADMLEGVSWAASLLETLQTASPVGTPLSAFNEALLVTLGLLAPCWVAYSVTAAGARRLVLGLSVLSMGFVGMTLSTLLNFGPAHALAWLAPLTLKSLGAAAVLALLAAALPPRLVAGIGLIALTVLVTGVSQAPDDPYFAQSLQNWEQGRFVRFHGLAQWVGWLWPYGAMLWLLSRLAVRRSSR